jgi:hypothetical protein
MDPELPATPLLSFDEFLERVARRTGLDRDRAMRRGHPSAI